MVKRASANLGNRKAEGEEVFRKQRQAAMEKNSALTTARTLISLSGAKAAEQAFFEYRKAAEDFWLAAGGNGMLTVEEFEQLYPGILAARDRLFEQLRQALP